MGKAKGNGRYQAPETDAGMAAWMPLIAKIGLRKGVSSAEIDDFVQQILLAWIEGDYLQKYSPEKGAFTTFLWAFIATRAMGYRDKHFRIDRNLAWGEITEEFDDTESGFSLLPADPVDYFQAYENGADMEILLEPLQETLIHEVIYHIYNEDVSETGKTIKRKYRIERSLYSLARLLLLGLTQREIAQIYRRSVGTVSAMVKELRSHPAMVQAVLGVHPVPDLMTR